MVFNTENKIGVQAAKDELQRLIDKKARVNIKEEKNSRTSAQNRSLHLFFKFVADELNNLGIPFAYQGLKGMELETEWTYLLVKEMTWKPIQKAMFGTSSTTKLERQQIDQIVDVIVRFFADRGIEINFPNSFDYYLKFYSNE